MALGKMVDGLGLSSLSAHALIGYAAALDPDDQRRIEELERAGEAFLAREGEAAAELRRVGALYQRIRQQRLQAEREALEAASRPAKPPRKRYRRRWRRKS